MSLRQFIAVYVTPIDSREVIHHEVFEATRLSGSEYSQTLRVRQDALAQRFPRGQYKITSVGYGSMTAMRADHPELAFPDLE